MSNASGRSSEPVVLFQRLRHGAGISVPAYATAGAAGADLCLATKVNADGTFDEKIEIQPGERCVVGTGFNVAIPDGYEGMVRGRSGLAFKQGVRVFHFGTIDADFRGEIKTILENCSLDTVTFHRGDRIAQLIIAPVAHAIILEADSLDLTVRGDAGYGSTGIGSLKMEEKL